jgi:heme/copper-type cytochrome/quinol oxidase subunit 3
MRAASEVQRVNWTRCNKQQPPIQEGSTLFRRQTSLLLSSSATLQAAHTVVEGRQKLRQGRNQAMFRQ